MPESRNKAANTSTMAQIFSTGQIDEQIRKERELREKFTAELKEAYEQGEDISEYVWPHEWDFRKRPKPHHANNIISLPDAIDVCGQHFYGAAWNEKDWYARSPEEIEQWNPAHNLYRAWGFSEKKKGADFTNRPEEEKEAFVRKQEIYSQLSSWLNQSTLESFTLDSEGNKGSVSANIWLSSDALDILDSGKISEKEDGKTKIGGKSDFVYLNKEQLQKLLNKEKPSSKIETKKEFSPKGITCPEGIWSLEAMLRFSDKEKGEEGQDRKMGEICQDFLHFLVTTPTLEVFTISSYDGHKAPIDRDYLRSKSAASDFLRGFIPNFDGFHVSKEDGEFIFVNRQQYENFLAGRPIAENPVSDIKPEDNPSYIPAYLDLMLKAVKALNLSPDKRANMDNIINWLNNNWPPDLEGKSDRMIKSMATFLRRPQDKKGGNTSWK